MHCVKCGTEIPEGGLFCPKCGASASHASNEAKAAADIPANDAKGKPKAGCLKIGLWVLAAFVVLGVIGNFLPKTESDKKATNEPVSMQTGDAKTESEAAETATEKPIAVTANELFGAYQANEASAQGYFGKRQLLVTGSVDKVALDLFDNPEILLRTSNQFMSAHAALADDAKASAGDYNPGQKVRLLCEDVSEVASIPMLKDCRQAPDDLKGEPVQWKK